MGASPEQTGDPANSGTPAVQMERQASRGVHSRPTGVPGVPDGFLVDIHHFRTRMNHPGHLRTLAAPLTALPALGYQPGFSRDNQDSQGSKKAKSGSEQVFFLASLDTCWTAAVDTSGRRAFHLDGVRYTICRILDMGFQFW